MLSFFTDTFRWDCGVLRRGSTAGLTQVRPFSQCRADFIFLSLSVDFVEVTKVGTESRSSADVTDQTVDKRLNFGAGALRWRTILGG